MDTDTSPQDPIESLALLTDFLNRAATTSSDLRSDFMYASISKNGNISVTFDDSGTAVALANDLHLAIDHTHPDDEDGFVIHWYGTHAGRQVSIGGYRDREPDETEEHQDPFQTGAVLQSIFSRLTDSLPELSEVLLATNLRSDGQISLIIKNEVSATTAAETLHLSVEAHNLHPRWFRWSGTDTGRQVKVTSFPDFSE